MDQHIGKPVIIPGESKDATIREYRGHNTHGTPMFLVELASKATRLYSGHRLLVRNGRNVAPLVPNPTETTKAA